MTTETLPAVDITQGQSIMTMDRQLLPAPLERLQEVANMLAGSAALVPAPFRGKPELCLGIAYQAALWGTDPVATAQKAYLASDNGTIAYEAQLIHAICSRHFDNLPTYILDGNGPQRFCVVTVKVKGQTLSLSTPRIAVIHPKNSPNWKSNPDQQLCYYAIRALCRRYLPDVLLGIYAIDEIQTVEVRDITKRGTDPFNDEDEEIEDAVIEPVTPSGGEEYQGEVKLDGKNQGPDGNYTAKKQQPTEVEPWPLNDDPMAFFEEAKKAADKATSPKDLHRVWAEIGANRGALEAFDPISGEELAGHFNARLKALGG